MKVHNTLGNGFQEIIYQRCLAPELEEVHLAQAKNYVVAYQLPIGLLINFGAISLQFKKVFNSKLNPVSIRISGFKDGQDGTV